MQMCGLTTRGRTTKKMDRTLLNIDGTALLAFKKNYKENTL